MPLTSDIRKMSPFTIPLAGLNVAWYPIYLQSSGNTHDDSYSVTATD